MSLVPLGGEGAHRDGGLGRQQALPAGRPVAEVERQEPCGVVHVADEPAVGRPVDVERPEGHQAVGALADDPGGSSNRRAVRPPGGSRQ